MKQIRQRYLGIIACIVVILVFLNGFIIYAWNQWGTTEYPKEFSRMISTMYVEDGTYKLSEESGKFIHEKFIWAMIINQEGAVIYEYELPESLKREYTIGEVADFSNWYLENYPVTVLNSPAGVVVLGEKEGSLWKQNIAVNHDKIAFFAAAVLLFNVLAGVLLACVLSNGFSKKLKILVSGIYDLASNQVVNLPERGYLNDICRSINQVSNKLVEQRLAIQKGNEIKKRWITGVSHDIRTPLEIMVGNLDEVTEKIQEEEIRKQLKLVSNQCFKIKTLLADLNLANSLEMKMQRDTKTEVNPCRVIRNCIADMMNTFDDTSYTYDFMCGEDADILISADENLLKRAFSNLLMNSVLHNENGCQISVAVERCGAELQIRFKDDGVGITEEKRKQLAAAMDNSEDGVHGWGIIVVKQIAEFHNGKVEFPVTEQGMEVRMILPV